MHGKEGCRRDLLSHRHWPCDREVWCQWVTPLQAGPDASGGASCVCFPLHECPLTRSASCLTPGPLTLGPLTGYINVIIGAARVRVRTHAAHLARLAASRNDPAPTSSSLPGAQPAHLLCPFSICLPPHSPAPATVTGPPIRPVSPSPRPHPLPPPSLSQHGPGLCQLWAHAYLHRRRRGRWPQRLLQRRLRVVVSLSPCCGRVVSACRCRSRGDDRRSGSGSGGCHRGCVQPPPAYGGGRPEGKGRWRGSF